MKVATCSIVCGSTACNASCPFCISKVSAGSGKDPEPREVNYHKFQIFKKAAAHMQASTFLLTGRGEPTLYPEQVRDYLTELQDSPVPFREMQTNGIRLMDDYMDYYMRIWYDLGLNTICISAVHYLREPNRQIYSRSYPELSELVAKLHRFGFSVRLSIMMLDGYIGDKEDVSRLIDFCRANRVDQLTIRPITAPDKSANEEMRDWIFRHCPYEEDLKEVRSFLERKGDIILELPHGGTVFDVDGQNVCYATCITTSVTTEDIRQLIFYPEGRISHDWKYEGAVLL